MSGAGRRADPVEEYAATLAAALRGPARAKARMVEEMRDGLADAAEAHTRQGTPRRRAVDLAVREFGTVDEVAPSCQRELTVAQTRHTARTVVLSAPLLIVCWYPLLAAGDGPGRELPGPARLLAVQLAGVAAVAALLAVVTLAATGPLARRLPVPRGLPLAVAWTGTTAGVAMVLATLTLAIASPSAGNWPLITFACGLTAVAHGMVAASARMCRVCART
ncbi:permease prefix domain 1-containing protein [Streptomyces sp. NRRL F-5135]|uniref:permease prefix domain 1-containing protein n=1 Tax=Streptomyces sp. NRRL F-5135 TaxID=1463858 RepID=UPI0004CABB85|nr:permease prefix domain 1-containing protein [Streptomyces sp. NRRL F-5135]